MLANIKLEQGIENIFKHNLTINGRDFGKYTHRVKISLNAGEIPQAEIGIRAEALEYSGQANVKFDCTPGTIQQAAAILKNAIQTDSGTYNAFLESVKSVFNEPDAVKCNAYEISKRIIDRIIG